LPHPEIIGVILPKNVKRVRRCATQPRIAAPRKQYHRLSAHPAKTLKINGKTSRSRDQRRVDHFPIEHLESQTATSAADFPMTSPRLAIARQH
jgi:hypothetical protein